MKRREWLQVYPLIRVAFALIIGIVIGNTYENVVPVVGWLIITIAVLLITLLLRKQTTLQGIGILCTIVCLGIILIPVQQQQQYVHLSNHESISKGVILTEPKQKGKAVQCDIYVVQGEMKGRKVRASILRDTIDNRYKTLHIGQGIAFFSVFNQVTNYPSSSNFNYQRWMQVHGYAAQTFIYYRNWQHTKVNFNELPRIERLRLLSQNVRMRLLSQYSIHGIDNQDYAVVAAMTLGDKSFLSKQIKNVYSITGASHVLALSGLHLSILFSLLYFVFGGQRQLRFMAFVFIVLTIWVYVFITGMLSSVLRSATMLTIYLVVSLLHRNKVSLNALAFAAIMMLLFNPMQLWDVSFQMSFMAVLFILLLFRPIYILLPQRFLMRYTLFNKLWSMIVVSVVAQIGTAPLVLYYFGRFSCYFLLTNLVAIPLTTLILYIACLMFVLSFSIVLQTYVAKVLFLLVQWLNTYLNVIASWRGASIEHINISTWQLYLIYIMISCICAAIYYLRKAYRQAKLY